MPTPVRIESIAIGTELLTTERVDTHSIWIARRLMEMGLGLQRKTAIGDDREALAALFQESLPRSDLVICTGGLGPTFDDFTKEVWAEVLGAPLIDQPHLRREIEAFFAARQRPCPPNNAKQALMPLGSEALPNPVGTAPGCWWEHQGRRIVMLPGPPQEMKRMWLDHIEPRLKNLFAAHRPTHTLRMLVGSVGESALEHRTAALRQRHGHLEWTILASLGQVELLARSTEVEALEAARRDFELELGEDRICTGEGTLESTVLDLLMARGETLALAESITGGRVAARLTAVPGASGAFLGGAVAYTPQAKLALAGLSEAQLAQGTVSAAVTEALAQGVKAKLGATWGLAITGNAGPTEDPHGPAPVGTSFFAVAGPHGTRTQHSHLPADRPDVQARSTTLALDFLRREMVRR
ncbi:MAG: CinA family nicotinamide mononucleotide deamidase-related protein [Firmicutes bacterium]|nr:CinA family nicotinamide mononucleotide deamidase-related protein [Bacillota bacterium]